MEKKLKTQEEIQEEDENLFREGAPPHDIHRITTGDLRSLDVLYLQECAGYLLRRLPEDFITRELLFTISEVDTISSVSTISEDELEEVGQVHYNDEVINKTLRETFYELIIEKHYDKIKPSFNDEDASEGKVKHIPEGDGQSNKFKIKKRNLTIMESDSDEGEEAMIISAMGPTGHLTIQEDIHVGEEHIEETMGWCKSLKAVLEDVSKSKRNRDYHINNIICLFKYDSCELHCNESPIEIEISDAIYNLNSNTLKPEDNLYSLITGCIIVDDGTGILNLEISLFDLIRLIVSLKWSLLKQKITEIKVLSAITDITPIFETFTTCRTFFTKNDNRHFPKILKVRMRKRQKNIKVRKAGLRKPVMKTPSTNDKDYFKRRLRYLKNISKRMGFRFEMKNNKKLPSIKKLKKVLRKKNFKHSLEYLNEISEKLCFTFKLLKHQIKGHPCGVAELPPCASQHLPSKNLILWALKCNYLKKWEDLVQDILQPEPYLDSSNNSYPAPTSLINFHYLSTVDRNKTLTRIMHQNGFYPKFNENNQPKLVLPTEFMDDIDVVFENMNVQLINVSVNELNALRMANTIK